MPSNVHRVIPETTMGIPEAPDRLFILDSTGPHYDTAQILARLKQDDVVLVPNVDAAAVDGLICEIAERLNLKDSLELQAAFASSLGHRKNIGQYYMSVNERKHYHIVPPHSEGSSFVNLQIASFYCYENTTDGGETIVMNVDESSPVWDSLREHRVRGRFERPPTKAEIARARTLYRLNLPSDSLQTGDQIISRNKVDANLTVFNVLAKPSKSYSCILEQQRYGYWDSVMAVDRDSLKFMEQFLKQEGLLKEPPDYQGPEQLDWDSSRRLMNSGIDYDQLFKCKISIKLKPQDFLIQNNFSWTHSVNNWTPGTGVRKVAAAFA